MRILMKIKVVGLDWWYCFDRGRDLEGGMGQLWLVFTLSSARGGGGKKQPERERENRTVAR